MRTGTIIAIVAAAVGGALLLKGKDEDDGGGRPDIPDLPDVGSSGAGGVGVSGHTRVTYGRRKIYKIDGQTLIKVKGVPGLNVSAVAVGLCSPTGVSGMIQPIGGNVKQSINILAQEDRHPGWTIWDWCGGWITKGAWGLPAGYYFAIGGTGEEKMVFGPFDSILGVQTALNAVLSISPSDARKKAM